MKRFERSYAALAAALALTSAGAATAQPAADVRTIAADAKSPAATVADLKGMIGDWQGKDAQAGFSGPMGGAIVGHLALSTDKGPRIYEMWIIRQEGDTVLVRQKHFAPADLKQREDKDVWSERKLVAVTPGHIYFNNLTFANEGGTLHLTVRIPGQNGAEPSDLNYTLQRARPPGPAPAG